MPSLFDSIGDILEPSKNLYENLLENQNLQSPSKNKSKNLLGNAVFHSLAVKKLYNDLLQTPLINPQATLVSKFLRFNLLQINKNETPSKILKRILLQIDRKDRICLQCNYHWIPKIVEPRLCAQCKSPNWRTHVFSYNDRRLLKQLHICCDEEEPPRLFIQEICISQKVAVAIIEKYGDLTIENWMRYKGVNPS